MTEFEGPLEKNRQLLHPDCKTQDGSRKEGNNFQSLEEKNAINGNTSVIGQAYPKIFKLAENSVTITDNSRKKHSFLLIIEKPKIRNPIMQVIATLCCKNLEKRAC